jgi:hydrogenase maturation protease
VTTTDILVAGIGNLFNSDDGFGPEVTRRLGAIVLPDGIRVVDYGIRGMHLAYDLLDPPDALILVDAIPEGRPGELRVIEVDVAALGPRELDPHQMDPVAVLSGARRLGGTLPRTYVVGCRPETTADGIGLSEAVEDAIDRAAVAVLDLVDRLRSPWPQPGTAGEAAKPRHAANVKVAASTGKAAPTTGARAYSGTAGTPTGRNG